MAVKGTASTLSGHVAVSTGGGGGLVLEEIRVALPVISLSTGMKVRDEHMRKYIFATQDGRLPDVEFSAERSVCRAGSGQEEYTCLVAGNLAIRGTPHAFEISLSVKGSAGAYHASGEGVVKLSDYAIERPTQFGVSTADEVKLRLKLSARQKPPASVTSGGGSR